MSNCIVYLNHQPYHESDAPELALDRGLFFGDGVFESLRVYKRRFLGLDDHLERLYQGLETIVIEPPFPLDELKNRIEQYVRECPWEDLYLRISITRGKWMGSIPPLGPSHPNLIVTLRKFLPFQEELYERGYHTLTLSVRRNETSPLSGIKSLNYLDNILGRLQALKKGNDDGLFLNTQNRPSEMTASNLFLIKGDRLVTPPITEGILPGITRKIILGKASSLGLEVEERPIKPLEIAQADEAFLTNSLMGIIPWTSSDEQIIGSGKAGAWTKKLRSLYQSLISASI